MQSSRTENDTAVMLEACFFAVQGVPSKFFVLAPSALELTVDSSSLLRRHRLHSTLEYFAHIGSAVLELRHLIHLALTADNRFVSSTIAIVSPPKQSFYHAVDTILLDYLSFVSAQQRHAKNKNLHNNYCFNNTNNTHDGSNAIIRTLPQLESALHEHTRVLSFVLRLCHELEHCESVHLESISSYQMLLQSNIDARRDDDNDAVHSHPLVDISTHPPDPWALASSFLSLLYPYLLLQSSCVAHRMAHYRHYRVRVARRKLLNDIVVPTHKRTSDEQIKRSRLELPVMLYLYISALMPYVSHLDQCLDRRTAQALFLLTEQYVRSIARSLLIDFIRAHM